MWQSLRLLLPLAILFALPLSAQDWSLGLGTGPFVFGDFVRQTVRPVGGNVGDPATIKLSAKTSPGFAIDLERNLTGWLAIRLEGTYAQSKLRVKSSSAGGVSLDVGDLNVTTAMAPFVVRLNQRGSFRFHVMGGPAYAMYDINRTTPAQSAGAFEGTRSQWGGAAGGGVGWWLSDRFAIEGQITDIVTSSPFHRSELGDSERIKIPKPQNVHTTVGLRMRF